jgi:hypothetical protein
MTKMKTTGPSKARKGTTRNTPAPEPRATAHSASDVIDQQIRDLGGWRGETLARTRALILEADPNMTE